MKATKEQLIAENHDLHLENSRVWETLIAMTSNTDVWVGSFVADGWTVGVRLINPTRAHGGILYVSSKSENNGSWQSMYLEEQYRYMQHAYQNGEYGYKMRDLVGKAMVMRNKALDAEKAA